MSTFHWRVAIAIAFALVLATSVVLMSGSGEGGAPAYTGPADHGADDAAHQAPHIGADAHWPISEREVDDDDDGRQSVWDDPAVKPLEVNLIGHDGQPAGGVPVVVLGSGPNPPMLAGPRSTNSTGRVRFPIDMRMDAAHDVIVAARALRGAAVTAPAKVSLDQPTEVTLTVQTGIRAAIRVVDPEGRPYTGRVRVRTAITDAPRDEPGPLGEVLTRVFADVLPRGSRTQQGLGLVGLAPRQRLTLIVAAPGFAPTFTSVRVPRSATSPHPIDVRLEARVSTVQFVVVVPSEMEGAAVAFSCRPVELAGVVLAAGIDEGPTQTEPQFRVDVPPNVVHRLAVFAWRDGLIHAAAEVDVPALAESEVFDAGRVRLEVLPVVIAGVAVDEFEKPLAGVTVEAMAHGPHRDLIATTGEGGVFVLRGLPGRGPYHVSLQAPGRVAERVAGVAESTLDLRVRLEASGAIAGSVALPAGVDPGSVSVRAVAGGGGAFATSLSNDGSFELTSLPRGAYTVTVAGSGIQPVRVVDVIVNPPEVTLDRRLERVFTEAAPSLE